MIETNEKMLKQKSTNFQGSAQEFLTLIKRLDRELEECEYPGVGLAAIQIGLPIKVGILRTDKLSLNLFNVEIISGSEIKKMKEGCLSFPNVFIEVYRLENITIKNGDGEVYDLTGFEAQAVQHELDHFNGITMFDRRV